MIKRLAYYFKIWWLMNIKHILPTLSHNYTFIIFLIGKIFRFIIFGGFLVFLMRGTNTLSGYSLNQVIFFYVTFMFIDSTGQFLFREVFRFRPQIISGSFDLTLIKPINPLFRSLLGGADAIDLITLPPLIYLIFHFGKLLSPDPIHIFFYIILVANGLVISAAFYITVLAMGIITLEIDHTVMIFRDLVSFGRFPVDMYREPLKSVLTYLVPVGLMLSFPAKAFLGLISPIGVVLATAGGLAALLLSFRFWKYALTKYTSASS